jgi:hypothetical protein
MKSICEINTGVFILMLWCIKNHMGLFNKKEKWGNFGGNINIYADLNEYDIEKLIKEPDIHSLQFYQFKTPTEKTWKILEKFYQKYPQIRLHIFWYDPVDFDFLKYLPSVKKFAISSYMTKDFYPIKDYLDIDDLSIGETKSLSVNLDFVSSFTNLKSFYNDGMKKGFEVIADLRFLEVLTLRGVKLNDLIIVENLNKLKELNLLFGSYKNLDSIANLKHLRKLEISRTRQIPNYDFLNGLHNLESLCFEGMAQIETLPDLNGLLNLTKIQIDNNSRLTDITSIKKLKKLETFLLFFPENFKAAWRKSLMEQAYKIIIESETIKTTNLWRLMNDKEKENLKRKNIEFWGYNPEMEKIFNK